MTDGRIEINRDECQPGRWRVKIATYAGWSPRAFDVTLRFRFSHPRGAFISARKWANKFGVNVIRVWIEKYNTDDLNVERIIAGWARSQPNNTTST